MPSAPPESLPRLVPVNEAICEAGHGGPGRPGPSAGGRSRGLRQALAAEAAAEVVQLAAAAARPLAAGQGLEEVELALRAGLTRLGCSLLAADSGHRGPRTGCGAGHQAEFLSYRDKSVGTVLGLVTLNRAWHH